MLYKLSIHYNNFAVRQILFVWFAVLSSRAAIAMMFSLRWFYFVIKAKMAIRAPWHNFIEEKTKPQIQMKKKTTF